MGVIWQLRNAMQAGMVQRKLMLQDRVALATPRMLAPRGHRKLAKHAIRCAASRSPLDVRLHC